MVVPLKLQERCTATVSWASQYMGLDVGPLGTLSGFPSLLHPRPYWFHLAEAGAGRGVRDGRIAIINWRANGRTVDGVSVRELTAPSSSSCRSVASTGMMLMPRLFGDQWRSGLRMFRCGNKNVQQVSPHLICLSARHPYCSFVGAVFTCRWHLIGLMSEQVVDCIFTQECVLTWWEDFSLFRMSAFCLTRPSHFFTSLEITFDFLVYEPFIKDNIILCLPFVYLFLYLPLYLFIYICCLLLLFIDIFLSFAVPFECPF